MFEAYTLLALLVLVLTILAKPFGMYLLPIAKGNSFVILKPIDNFILRLMHLTNKEQTWKEYTISLICFNILGIIFLYILQRVQLYLPLNPQGFANIEPFSALNTAISFVTNTNWQGYSPESTMSYLVQMLGLGVQNFLSAATGIAVAFVLMRSFVLKESIYIGNFFVDVIRISLYILLPLSIIYAVFLISNGVIDNFDAYTHAQTIAQGVQIIPQGPVASQEAIKILGTNGGGFFNANSAHPFENPNSMTNFTQCVGILLIASALCYTFGEMVKDKRQGWTIFFAMMLMFVVACSFLIYFESSSSPYLLAHNAQDTFNTEGKDIRFSLADNALFSAVTTAASCGAVNNMHDSLNPMSGFITMLLMQIGEVVFGGVGSGFYGIVIFILITVFICGLMIGRTPEYLGKKISVKQMKLVSFTILVGPILVLVLTSISVMLKFNYQSLNNTGPHAFSELLYALSSAANNNGSAFAGLNANTPYFNIITAIAMFFGRFLVIILTLAIAGSLAKQRTMPQSVGTLPSYGVLFALLIIGTILLIGALTYIPALALGPVVEHLEYFIK